MNSLFDIVEVSLYPFEPGQLWGRHIDKPKPGSQGSIFALDIAGWVLGRLGPVTAVELINDGELISRLPPSVPRPDISKAYPSVENAQKSGFSFSIGILGLAPPFELLVQAVINDQLRVPLGKIRGTRTPLLSEFKPKIQPLLVTSLGRTGTTWLMRLLAEHPEIVAHRAYPYETRCASYWIHCLKVLSDPANYIESAHPDDFMYQMHWVGHNPSYSAPRTNDPEIRHWFGRTYVCKLAAFFQENIESFYLRVATSQGQTGPHFFAEKYNPGQLPWLVWELYPKAREIFLVRDFRDVFCSILATNAKRGSVGFGRQLAGSDEEYVKLQGAAALRLLQNWKARAEKAKLVRYEELIEHPRETLENILAYLGLERSPAVIQGILSRATVDTREMQQHRTTVNPKASIGRWRKDLTPSLHAVVDNEFGNVLQEFGYAN